MEASKIVIAAEAGMTGLAAVGRAATRNARSWMEQALSRKCNAFFPGYGAEVVEE